MKSFFCLVALSVALAQGCDTLPTVKEQPKAANSSKSEAAKTSPGLESTARILFYKIDERDYDVLKTFLSYLNIMPDVIYGIRGKNISTADIPIDLNIAEILKRI